MRNWIADQNPFNLAAPPVWFMTGLSNFDKDLVLLPSRQRPVYWLARRKYWTAGAPPILDGVDQGGDAKMLRQHNLIDVTWVQSIEGFTEGFLLYICDELRSRDTWQFDGPMNEDDIKRAMFEGRTKTTDVVEARDRQAEARLNAQIREDCWHATGEAWRQKQYLEGAMSKLSDPIALTPPVVAPSVTTTPDTTAQGASSESSAT